MPHAVAQRFVKQLAKVVYAASLLHEAGGLELLTQLTHVVSLAQAADRAQHMVSRQASQVALPVVKPQFVPPLELLEELVVVVPLELLELDELVLELLPQVRPH
jgi:hypothetical protein